VQWLGVVFAHADRGQVLLKGGLFVVTLQSLDVGRDVLGLDIDERADPGVLAPIEKAAYGPVIGLACVFVADSRSEELQEAPRGALARELTVSLDS